MWDEVVIFNIFIIEESFEDFYQHEPWISYGKAIWIECVFYVDSFFLFVATAQKLAYRWIRYKTLKALCFSLPWKWQNVKSKQKVQEILWKQSLETFCMKNVIISNYRLQLFIQQCSECSLWLALKEPEELLLLVIFYFLFLSSIKPWAMISNQSTTRVVNILFQAKLFAWELCFFFSLTLSYRGIRDGLCVSQLI